ncbi:hypothetical protein AGR7C_Cc110135 [Agrobacterium deltaense Zutra 3/1]|uniref:Uncharacterized protein n=1 Tax=Agrobacterium deltaense Zutra 3/1 TaxID=1183427 RepID=A0A1S7P067_9HYPH|nr:hypothetical protein AGR7C_Cc110135 [Agrobacterium deltaense Zutra 3/1]
MRRAWRRSSAAPRFRRKPASTHRVVASLTTTAVQRLPRPAITTTTSWKSRPSCAANPTKGDSIRLFERPGFTIRAFCLFYVINTKLIRVFKGLRV